MTSFIARLPRELRVLLNRFRLGNNPRYAMHLMDTREPWGHFSWHPHDGHTGLFLMFLSLPYSIPYRDLVHRVNFLAFYGDENLSYVVCYDDLFDAQALAIVKSDPRHFAFQTSHSPVYGN